MYYLVKPEVAGEMGEGTVLDHSTHPPRVDRLEYEIGGWLGSDLMTTFPCFIVTETLAEKLTASGLGSFELRDVEITISPEGETALQVMGFSEFPKCKWFYVTGTAGHDDFGVTQKARLIVSDRGLEVVRQGRIEYVAIEEYNPEIHT